MKILAITLAAVCLISVFSFSSESMRSKNKRRADAKVHHKDCDISYSYDTKKAVHTLNAACKDGKKTNNVTLDLSKCKAFTAIAKHKHACKIDKNNLVCDKVANLDITKSLTFSNHSVKC